MIATLLIVWWARSLVIIVGEDGSIDLRPNLKGRLREDVADAVHRLVAASQGDVDFEGSTAATVSSTRSSSTWTNSSVTQSTRPERAWRGRHGTSVESGRSVDKSSELHENWTVRGAPVRASVDTQRSVR